MKIFFQIALAITAAGPAVALPLRAMVERSVGTVDPVLSLPPAFSILPPPTAGEEHRQGHPTHTHTFSSNDVVPTSTFTPTVIEPKSTSFPLSVSTTTDGSLPTDTASGTGVVSSSGSTSLPTSALSSGLPTSLLSTGFSTNAAPTAIPGTASTGTSTLLASTVIPAQSSASAATFAQPGSATSNGMLRGVNVGHWLILEKYMDDGTVFTGQYSDAVDQWTYDSIDKDGSDIRSHWENWFTESDAQKLASYGFNALRIPIGYWAFDNSGTPYTQGAADYLDKAIVWARNSGMKVLIDCHGSPGSQNGQEHSGRRGSVEWQQRNNLDSATQILQQMIQRYGGMNNSDVVFGLEIVNEPTADLPNSFSTSKSWATQAYSALQSTISQDNLNKDIQIITHDSFMGPTQFIPLLGDIKSPKNAPTFGVDQHNYQLYTASDNALDQPGHIQEACGWSSALATTKQSMPVIVGEWSAITNICVNSDGSSYASEPCDGSGNCATCPTDTWTPALVEQVRKYVEAQLDTFEDSSDGHFIWSFKSGSNSGWSVYDLIEAKAFPNPVTDRQYPSQCS